MENKMKIDGQWSLDCPKHKQGDLGKDKKPPGYAAHEGQISTGKMPAVERAFKQSDNSTKSGGGVDNSAAFDKWANNHKEKY
jgi:hypothetical protein